MILILLKAKKAYNKNAGRMLVSKEQKKTIFNVRVATPGGGGGARLLMAPLKRSMSNFDFPIPAPNPGISVPKLDILCIDCQ